MRLSCKRFVALAALATLPLHGQEPDAEEQLTDGVISVLVQNAQGEPLGDIEVFCAAIGGTPRLALSPSEQGRTDANGFATFDGLTAGNYYVNARQGRLGAWGRARVDLKTREAHIPLTMRLGRSMRGRIVDEFRKPLEGVQLLYRRVLPITVSNADGEFSVPNLIQATSRGTQISFLKEGYGWFEMTVALTTDPYEITLHPGGKIRFTALDPQGKVLPGSSVAYEAIDPMGVRVHAQMFFDNEGIALSPWIASDQAVEVFLSAPYGSKGQWDRRRDEIALTPGETVSAQFQWRPETDADPVPPKNFPRVSGRVIMADTGEAVFSGITWKSRPEYINTPKIYSDDNGVFETRDLPSRAYYFTALPIDPTLYHVGGPIRIDLTSGKAFDDLTLEIGRGSAIKGRVESADGVPVPGVQIMFEPTNPAHRRTIMSRQDGSFFLNHLVYPDKEYRLRAYFGRGTPATAKVGPLGRGVTSDPVILRLKDLYLKVHEKSYIQGIALDKDRRPLPHLKVALSTEDAPEEVFTDDDGKFRIPFTRGGMTQLTVSLYVTMYVNGLGAHRMKECEVLEGKSLILTKGTTVEGHRMIVAVPELRWLAGDVLDGNGNLLDDVDLLVWYPNGSSSGHAREGRFLMNDLPLPPFVIEFAKDGYRARVVQTERDFQLGDADLRVTMFKGPFQEEQHVFAAVTGFATPPKDIFVAGHATNFSERAAQWIKQAAIPDEAEEARSLRPGAFKARIVDRQGQPVTRVFLQHSTGLPAGRDSRSEKYYLLEKARNREIVESVNNIFTIAHHGLIWTEDSARVYVKWNREAIEEVQLIQLPAPASVTIRVTGDDGAPIEGLHVLAAASNANDVRAYGYVRQKTDSSGQMHFDRLVPGPYAFQIARIALTQNEEDNLPHGNPVGVIAFEVEAGGAYTREVIFGFPKAGSPEAILEHWRDYLRGSNPNAPPTPSPNEKIEITGLVIEELERLPGINREEAWNTPQLMTLIRRMDLPGVDVALSELLLRWRVPVHHSSKARVIGAMAETLAEISGALALDTFVKAAADTGLTYATRREAVIGLGSLGSPEAIQAYTVLRAVSATNPYAPDVDADAPVEAKIIAAVRWAHLAIPEYVYSGTGPDLSVAEIQVIEVAENDLETTAIVALHIPVNPEDFVDIPARFIPPPFHRSIRLKKLGGEWLVTR